MDALSKTDSDDLTDPVTERDHALGSYTASITIVEYGDYECPTCLNAVPVVKEVQHKLGNRLCFVFRHFPQSSIHPHASTAAEAAEAAADQGKFWEMHEALFQHQKELAEIDLSHLALTLGLEIYRFETSRSQEKHRLRISTDFNSGRHSGVRKTPTLFINGRRYDGPIDAKAIIAASEAAMAKIIKS
ncbi:MAG TPA: DsbA family protein [Tepidisphaeraceae bacterium]|jgi:protein-disulfide isomerase|nr:DsbA family protein [Tepidisphaeraceae bacterium]